MGRALGQFRRCMATPGEACSRHALPSLRVAFLVDVSRFYRCASRQVTTRVRSLFIELFLFFPVLAALGIGLIGAPLPNETIIQ